jgi:hypothetical protein
VKRLNKIRITQDCCIELDHHTRKIAPGQEITTDDVRGGGALVNATRSCRVINRMTAVEGETARVDKKDCTQHLRIDNGKRNMAPAENAKRMRLVSVALPNGDNVRAIEHWEFAESFRRSCDRRSRPFPEPRERRKLSCRQSVASMARARTRQEIRPRPEGQRRLRLDRDNSQNMGENGVLKKVQRKDEKRELRWFYEPGEAETEADYETEA